MTSKHYVERWIYWNFVIRVRFFKWKYYAMHSEISERTILFLLNYLKIFLFYVGLHCRIKGIGNRFLYKAIISSKTGTLFSNIIKIKIIKFKYRIESLFNESLIFMQILRNAVHSKNSFIQYKTLLTSFWGMFSTCFSTRTWPGRGCNLEIWRLSSSNIQRWPIYFEHLENSFHCWKRRKSTCYRQQQKWYSNLAVGRFRILPW